MFLQTAGAAAFNTRCNSLQLVRRYFRSAC